MRRVSCAGTAKLVRAALKTAFPGQKFSVRSQTYAGGASNDNRWTDGPSSTEVDKVAGQYNGAGFDGMIDLKTYNHDWLYPDGHVESFQSEIGHSHGSATYNGDGGPVDPEAANDYIAGVFSTASDGTTRRHNRDSIAYRQGVRDARLRIEQGAELVHFGADYIFTQRDLSPAAQERLEHAVVFLGGEPGEAFDGNKRYHFAVAGRWFEEYGSTLVHQLAHVDAGDLTAAMEREADRRACRQVDGMRLCQVPDGNGGMRLEWQAAS